MFFTRKSSELTDTPIAGRSLPLETQLKHTVNGQNLKPPFPDGTKIIYLGMGCFWGVERLFWKKKGVVVTAAGYGGGNTNNPNYREVCSGRTNHTELVMVVYDPDIVSTYEILEMFWENHDPTQGMRQGNDAGTQYRSAIYATDADQLSIAKETCSQYQQQLNKSNAGQITTEINIDKTFYYAEAQHQQYLSKNPDGYCSMRGTGIYLK